MYAGHFAIGLALQSRFPRVRPWIPLVGVGLIDLIDGVLVATGVERVSVAPGEPLGFALDFIDWDHSLLMAAFWSLAFAALFWREGRVAAVALAAAFSHFLADLLVHNGDLALWPHSKEHLGFFLWHRFPTGSWFIEGAFVAVLVALFVRGHRARGVAWRELWAALAIVVVLHLNFSPWLSPMRLLAQTVAPPAVFVLHGMLVFVGFAVPALLLSRFVPQEPRDAR